MNRLTLGMGVCALGMSSIFALGKAGSSTTRPGAATEPAPGSPAIPSTGTPELPMLPAETVAPAGDPGEFSALGFYGSTVPPELSTHLGLVAGEGVLVERLTVGSLAERSNLKPFDVIVSVEGQVATLESLQAALLTGKGLALSVVSGGVLRDLTLDGEPGVEGDFLSIESLGPNHPMRRVGRLEALRSRYAETTEKYEQRKQELDQEARQERKLATEEIEALLEASDKRVRAYFDAEQAKLLKLIEEELSEARVQPLSELGIELDELLTPERLEAIDAELSELFEGLKSESQELLKLTHGDEHADRAQGARRRLGGLMDDQLGRIRERVWKPYDRLQKDLEQHRERLGKNHAERVAWTSKTVLAIHDQVKERIECAFDRSAEVFRKRLRERLRRMELPRPGEVEASLEDITGQVEAWSQSFITRVRFDLRHYSSALSARPKQLRSELLAQFKGCEASIASLERDSRAALKTQLASAFVVDDSWQSRNALSAMGDGLRMQMSVALLASRRQMGESSAQLGCLLREDRELSDDAWSDLRKKLGRLLQEAGNNCWELRGPYLDGRFPRQKGEVSMLR